MNYFLALKIWEKDRVVHVRPEHVSTVEQRDDNLVVVTMTNADVFWVEGGQFAINKLINHTGHAGLKVLK
jgi:hypothetical protein